MRLPGRRALLPSLGAVRLPGRRALLPSLGAVGLPGRRPLTALTPRGPVQPIITSLTWLPYSVQRAETSLTVTEAPQVGLRCCHATTW